VNPKYKQKEAVRTEQIAWSDHGMALDSDPKDVT